MSIKQQIINTNGKRQLNRYKKLDLFLQQHI